MGSPPQDRRDSLAQGYMWATRATSIALQAVIPAGLGYWLDHWWGTAPWLLIVGTVLGFVSMMTELIAFTKPKKRPPPNGSASSADHPKT